VFRSTFELTALLLKSFHLHLCGDTLRHAKTRIWRAASTPFFVTMALSKKMPFLFFDNVLACHRYDNSQSIAVVAVKVYGFLFKSICFLSTFFLFAFFLRHTYWARLRYKTCVMISIQILPRSLLMSICFFSTFFLLFLFNVLSVCVLSSDYVLGASQVQDWCRDLSTNIV